VTRSALNANPARRFPEQHVGFLIEGCRNVLHTGDADPGADNFTVLRGLPPVDVAVVPFWYVLGERSRAFLGASIKPRRIIAMHLPPADANDVAKKLADAPNVTLLTRAETQVTLKE
jgi:L-ascorbate metabolism protein UlaG (beta-lactamase superfamily)